MNTHFKILIPVYNSKWILSCLRSVNEQNYDNFECFVVDDCSTDRTFEMIQKYVGDLSNFHCSRNEERVGALCNHYRMFEKLIDNADDEDVVIFLDGDDWLYDNDVFSKLDDIYTKEDCWLTYGSYVTYPSGVTSEFHVGEYPEEIRKNGDFKFDSQWRASHLRTSKYKLCRQIEKEDFLDEDGNFYQMAWDHAMMIPLMEMACEKVHFVPDTLYVYNDDNPLNVHKVDRELQIKTAEQIKSFHSKKDSLVGKI